MANEYFVNSADLTAIADAIRTKGNTNGSLSFPNEFVAAIEALSAKQDLHIYQAGYEESDVTGGLTNSGYTYGGNEFGAVTKNSDNIYFQYGDTNSRMLCAGTDWLINLTGYSTLHVDCMATGDNGLIVRVATTKEVGGASTSILAQTTGVSGNKTRTELTVDVSMINRACYIVVIGGGMTQHGYVYNIWLT